MLRFPCHDISEGQKGDQGGRPKMAKISCGVKILDFGPPLRPKAGQKLSKKSGGVKHGYLQEGGPKMA